MTYHRNRPTARYEERGRRRPFGFTLNDGEQEVFDLTVYTADKAIVDLYLRIGLVVDGQS